MNDDEKAILSYNAQICANLLSNEVQTQIDTFDSELVFNCLMDILMVLSIKMHISQEQMQTIMDIKYEHIIEWYEKKVSKENE